MKFEILADRAIGLLLLATALLVICNEWGIAQWATPYKPALVIVLLAVLTTRIKASRIAFVLVAVALSIALALTNPDWRETVERALAAAAFIGAFLRGKGDQHA